MVRLVTPEEKEIISQLAEIGKTDLEIATQLGWTDKLKDPERAVAKQRLKMGLKRFDAKKNIQRDPNNITLVPKTRLLETMTKDERFNFIKNRIANNPRNKLVLKDFSSDEKETFLDQYYSILQSTDSITEAEEQQLFIAIVEYVLAFRSLGLKSEEEKCVQETLDGMHQKGDARYKLSVDSSYNEEYDTHLQNYKSFISDLKMSRKQRLDKVKSEKRTLIDVAAELSNKSNQSIAIDQIEQLALLKDEELKKMIDKGHLLGSFGEE